MRGAWSHALETGFRGMNIGSLCTGYELSRTQQLKILGNGVVPQQAYHAISLIMDTVNNV